MMKNVIQKLISYNEEKYLKQIRKKNSNTNPTIVCNNCIAGVIYHNLGLKFLSPTINLYIKGQEYLEFVKHFKYYSECDIKEVIDKNVPYPVGKIIPKDNKHAEIMVYFQHYSSFDEAKSKWLQRYSRVNWENIFYIWEFYDTLYNKELMYEFDKLELENKIILTHRNFDDLNNSFEITCYNNDLPTAQILKHRGVTGKRYLDEFDYIKFLNSYCK